MDSVFLFGLQICIPLILGSAVAAYLRTVTRRLLAELCGTAERAEFWLRITAVLTFTTPLVLVLIFGHTPSTCSFAVGDCASDAVRQAFSLSLVGILAAVAFLARAMWKQIPAPAPVAPQDGRP